MRHAYGFENLNEAFGSACEQFEIMIGALLGDLTAGMEHDQLESFIQGGWNRVDASHVPRPFGCPCCTGGENGVG